MNIEIIHKSKVGIHLEHEDMCEYNITYDTMSYDDPQTKKILWQLLLSAAKKTGFDPRTRQLLIEVFPVPTGGCVIYYTKLDGGKHTARRFKKIPLYLFSLYEFANFDDMEKALATACRAGKPKCRLYLSGGKYCLLTWGAGARNSAVHYCFAEFSTQNRPLESDLFFVEHAKLISCDPVNDLHINISPENFI